jgi:uncharacterized protein (TIGR03435 family)
MKQTLFSVGLVALSCWPAVAQQFDVASIKPSDPNGGVSWRDLAGQSNYSGVTVKMLIMMAYHLRDFQLVGGPAWISSNRYDVSAKAPTGIVDFPADPITATDKQRETFREQRQAMVRALLTDRFKLKTHTETQSLPIYVLTVAKDGPKLNNDGRGPNPDLKPGTMMFRDGRISAVQIGVEYLAQTLAGTMDRIIVNKTGLKGNYNIDLRWTPDRGVPTPPDAGGSAPATLGQDAPTIFTALREQLGLKLDSARGPVEVVVIDSVEIPAEN